MDQFLKVSLSSVLNLKYTIQVGKKWEVRKHLKVVNQWDVSVA